MSENNAIDIVCPVCGVKNKFGTEYCTNCGCGLKKIAAQMQEKTNSKNDGNNKKEGAAFASINEETEKETQKPVMRTEKYIAPPTVFAEGLPEWDIVPPQVMVRRR